MPQTHTHTFLLLAISIEKRGVSSKSHDSRRTSPSAAHPRPSFSSCTLERTSARRVRRSARGAVQTNVTVAAQGQENCKGVESECAGGGCAALTSEGRMVMSMTTGLPLAQKVLTFDNCGGEEQRPRGVLVITYSCVNEKKIVVGNSVHRDSQLKILDSPQCQAKHGPTARRNTISTRLPRPAHERGGYDAQKTRGRGQIRGGTLRTSALLAIPVGICASTRKTIPPHPQCVGPHTQWRCPAQHAHVVIIMPNATEQRLGFLFQWDTSESGLILARGPWEMFSVHARNEAKLNDMTKDSLQKKKKEMWRWWQMAAGSHTSRWPETP